MIILPIKKGFDRHRWPGFSRWNYCQLSKKMSQQHRVQRVIKAEEYIYRITLTKRFKLKT